MEKINLDSFDLIQLKKRLLGIKLEYDMIFGEGASASEVIEFCTQKVEQNFYFTNSKTSLNVVIGHLSLFVNDIPYNNFSKIMELETPLMTLMKENNLQICLN